MNHANPHPETPTRHRGRAGPAAALLRATVIGLGGVGRQVALQLAALGVPQLQLIDARTVGRSTHAAEGYAREDVARPRVHAVAQLCHDMNPQLEIHAWRRRSLRGLDLGGAVFLCTEPPHVSPSLTASAGRSVEFWGRCRIVGTIIRLDFRLDGDSVAQRAADPRSGTDSPSRRTTSLPIHIASVAAGLLISEFVRFSAGERPRRAIRLDVRSLILKVA
jgi:molybdopterin-synthase adenylyltransferase